MYPFISKGSKIRLKVFAWYQIIGGIAGLVVTIWLLARTAQISGLILIILLFACSLYGFSIFCGRLLLGDKYLYGLKLSIINQALQIFSFTMLGYGFRYVSGSMILASLKFSNGLDIGLNFSLTSTWAINIDANEKPFELAINFVAIYLVYFADKLRTTIKQEETICEHETPEKLTPMTENPTTDPA